MTAAPPSGAAGQAIDELVARLVAQFASPYDFLRELVQNAMDAGSDRVEIALHEHAVAGDDADAEVVFEIEVVDAGAGMDEAIIDGELTRLFASGKADDRTMAGGFGIGFVSVFAWQPEAVLLHTGRGTEAWELLFGRDRRFEKHRLDEPFEGTTLRLLRTGRRAERAGIAEAVRDSLWRWCRFCPIEISFDDVATGEGPERIHDVPLPSDEALVAVHEIGDTRVRVAFAVPPHAVLLRHGLVLAEGGPAELLPHAAQSIAASFDHLRVWADSPSLRTDIGRDHVIDDAGRVAVERVVVAKVHELRGALIERLVALAGTTASWTAALHQQYAYLHEHLRCERDALGAALDRPAIVRRAGGNAASFGALARAARYGVLAWCEPDAPESASWIALCEPAGVPVVLATARCVAGWLGEAAAAVGLGLQHASVAVRRAEPQAGAASLVELVATVLREAKLVGGVRLARMGAEPDALVGLGVGDTEVAVVGARTVPSARGHTLWLEERHVLVRAAMVHLPVQPLVSVAAIALAIAASWPGSRDRADELERVRDAIDALAKERG